MQILPYMTKVQHYGADLDIANWFYPAAVQNNDSFGSAGKGRLTTLPILLQLLMVRMPIPAKQLTKPPQCQQTQLRRQARLGVSTLLHSQHKIQYKLALRSSWFGVGVSQKMPLVADIQNMSLELCL